MNHPLDPLSADEIRRVSAIVRRDRGVGAGWRFASIELKEPAKADLPALESGELTGRDAVAVCWNRADGQAYRATVSLTGDKVGAWE
ncbi:MAG TPA: tyramine oxidase, partial [Trebonia sp.]|nr:tyramine oxidase [Trebonia sp.]